MPAESIYLDNNSTTPIDPRVVEAMTRAWRDCGANPASQHAPGRRTRRMIEEAREGILELLGAKTGGMDADQLIFTSGGTEANNLILFGIERTNHSRIWISGFEHPSIAAAAEHLRRCGANVCLATMHDDLDGWSDAWNYYPTCLVSVILASNETGVVYPLQKIAESFQPFGVPVHTDAVQAVGKIPVHFGQLGVRAMTVAAHKFHGPLGIGGLVLKHGLKLQPQLYGGFQQGGLRPGTENVSLAVGFHEALRIAIADLPQRSARMTALRDQLERSLKEFGQLESVPDSWQLVQIIGEDLPRLPNTTCVSFPGLNRQALLMALDMAGVACSTGSACASGSSEPSPTLIAMGVPYHVVQGAIRLSVGAFTTAEEVAEASRRILNAVKHLRSQKTA